MIMLIELPFVITALYFEYWPFEEWFGRLLISLLVLQQFAKSHLLLFVGITSYAEHTGNIFELSASRTRIMLAICWLTSIVVAVPIYFLVKSGANHDLLAALQHHFDYIEAFMVVYLISIFIFPFFVFILLMTRRNKEPFDAENPEMSEQPLLLSLALIIAHLLTNLPNIVTQMIVVFNPTAPGVPPTTEMSFVIHISSWIWYLGACIFPVIYAYYWPAFSVGLASIFYEHNYSSDTLRPLTRTGALKV
ncbi:hypothetical protein B4U80_12732 [Leptotrombidium deliense]|uniref:G-protein coupled receptors family 1 profile domain-containing protein n=1 Tax=Leptotrombidium deliense TaxID=299467 RepID=A0A443SPD0_9ACAR|nr:hypothetical protein B4U80_12732 [Leptotrombidium deliense]